MTISQKKRRVVVTDYTFPDLKAERAAAEQYAAEFSGHQCKSAEEVVHAVAGADVAVVQFAPMTAAAIDALAEGASIIRYGIGYDNIDLAAAFARGFSVGYVPDYCIEEVADHTVSLILASLRKLSRFDASIRAGQWKAVETGKPIKPFRETTIGFLGMGRIGRQVFARLQPFGFQFLLSDPQVDAAQAEKLGATKVERATLLQESDVISLHLPATAETRHIIDEKSLHAMKPGAVIVNTARGQLIDESALASALSKKVIGGAALDVFEVEPLANDSALRDAPNLILTPHAA